MRRGRAACVALTIFVAVMATVLVTRGGGGSTSGRTGHALAGSANPDDGIYIAPVDKVHLGSFVLIRDPDLQNVSSRPITIVSLHVTFPTLGATDVGHVAYVQTGDRGLLDTWRSTDGGPDAPWLRGRVVTLIGAVIAPHAYFLTNGCSYAKIVVTKTGAYVSSDLDITYRQGSRLYRQSLAGGYHLWTLGSPGVPGDD